MFSDGAPDRYTNECLLIGIFNCWLAVDKDC